MVDLNFRVAVAYHYHTPYKLLALLGQEQSVGQGRTSSPGNRGIRTRNVESATCRFPGVVVGSNLTLTARI